MACDFNVGGCGDWGHEMVRYRPFAANRLPEGRQQKGFRNALKKWENLLSRFSHLFI
jgi:hypothetical protein